MKGGEKMTEVQEECLKEYNDNDFLNFSEMDLLNGIIQSYKDEKDLNDDNPPATLCFIYLLAYDNILDKRIFKALNEFENNNIVKSFLHNELSDLAEKRHKTTKFNKLASDLLSSRKEQQRKNAKAPPSLSLKVVEDILDSLGIYVCNNLISKRTEIKGIGADEYIYSEFSEANADIGLTNLVYDECQKRKIRNSSGKSGINMIIYLLEAIADKNRYNPVLNMFEKYKNEDESNFNNIVNLLNLEDEFDILLLKKWLIQCVALANNKSYSNIANTEGLLTLQGPQAIGKTSFFKKIAVHQEWFVEGVELDTSNKDSKITALSGWITEIGELDATMKKNQPALKSFITNSVDRIRFPFGRKDTLIPRTTSMCATVNPKHFLKDSTGNHRYWIISVSKIDKDKLFSIEKESIKNMWGYIYSLYLKEPNSYRLKKDELEILNFRNIQFEELQPFEIEISSAFNFSIPKEKWKWYTPTQISTSFNNKLITADKVGRVITKLSKKYKDIEYKREATARRYFLPPIGFV